MRGYRRFGFAATLGGILAPSGQTPALDTELPSLETLPSLAQSSPGYVLRADPHDGMIRDFREWAKGTAHGRPLTSSEVSYTLYESKGAYQPLKSAPGVALREERVAYGETSPTTGRSNNAFEPLGSAPGVALREETVAFVEPSHTTYKSKKDFQPLGSAPGVALREETVAFAEPAHTTHKSKEPKRSPRLLIAGDLDLYAVLSALGHGPLSRLSPDAEASPPSEILQASPSVSVAMSRAGEANLVLDSYASLPSAAALSELSAGRQSRPVEAEHVLTVASAEPSHTAYKSKKPTTDTPGLLIAGDWGVAPGLGELTSGAGARIRSPYAQDNPQASPSPSAPLAVSTAERAGHLLLARSSFEPHGFVPSAAASQQSPPAPQSARGEPDHELALASEPSHTVHKSTGASPPARSTGVQLAYNFGEVSVLSDAGNPYPFSVADPFAYSDARPFAERDKDGESLLSSGFALAAASETAQAMPAPPPPPPSAGPPQPPGPGEFEVSEEDAQRALERALLQSGAALLPPGSIEFVPSLTYQFRRSAVPSEIALTPDGTVLITETVTRASAFEAFGLLRVGLPWGMQAEFGLPWDLKNFSVTSKVNGAGLSERDIDVHGLGDLTISLSKQILTESDVRPGLFAGVAWNSNFGEIKRSLPLGTGFHELSGGLTAVKRQDPLVFTAGFNYQYTFENNGFKLGDNYTPSVGMLFAISPETSLRFGQQITFGAKDKFNGTAIPGSEKTAGIFTFGLLSILGRGRVVNFTLGIGETADAPDVFVQIALPLRLN